MNCGDPKGNLYYYYFLKQNIVLRKGKEINRDSESSGERNQTSLTTLYKIEFLFGT